MSYKLKYATHVGRISFWYCNVDFQKLETNTANYAAWYSNADVSV